MLIPFSTSVIMSRIVHLLFAITSTSHYSISISLWCAFAIVYTSLVFCIFNYTYVSNCSSYATMFSSLASFCIICASTKWCSLVSSSSDFSMHTGSINVALGPICSLACQCHMLLRKNSTIDVLVISMSWIIVYANCIFSLYAFPSTHSKHDECDNNLTTNSWIFNIFFLSALFNSSSTSIHFNNYASSSRLCLCSLLWSSFSLAICCSFSIALFAFILLRTLKLQKCAQLQAINANYFQWLPSFFCP